MAGTLILCAGPIGNLGDAPPRLAEALASAEVVLAEDTRRARVLLRHLGVDRPLRSYFVGNESERAGELKERLAAGQTVVLLTDAGTPGIADPGLSAVRAALECGAEVTGVPGASAVTLAVSVSGMPGDRFVFDGFLPRRGIRRTERIGHLGREERTIVLFAAPGRLVEDLEDLATVLGEERAIVICRELTKMYEEVWRGTLGEAAEWAADTPPRGEIALVVDGAPRPEAPTDGDVIAELRRSLADGATKRDAAAEVAERLGLGRNRVYSLAVGIEP